MSKSHEIKSTKKLIDVSLPFDAIAESESGPGRHVDEFAKLSYLLERAERIR